MTQSIQIDLSHGNTIPAEWILTEGGQRNQYLLTEYQKGFYKLHLTVRAKAVSELAQLPITVFKNGRFMGTVTLTGADTEWKKTSPWTSQLTSSHDTSIIKLTKGSTIYAQKQKEEQCYEQSV